MKTIYVWHFHQVLEVITALRAASDCGLLSLLTLLDLSAAFDTADLIALLKRREDVTGIKVV